MGDRKQMITDATMICGSIMGNLTSLSSLYETDPWGFSSPNKFMNAAICIETEHSPEKCLAMAKAIERELGRRKTQENGYEDRSIDIDILFYDDLTMASEPLTIPHPLAAERDFVLRPMAEIAPDFTHPVLRKGMAELLEEWEKENSN